MSYASYKKIVVFFEAVCHNRQYQTLEKDPNTSSKYIYLGRYFEIFGHICYKQLELLKNLDESRIDVCSTNCFCPSDLAGFCK